MRPARAAAAALVCAARLAASAAVAGTTRQADAADLALFAQYSWAAYCTRLYDGRGPTAVCSNAREAACAGFANVSSVVEFRNDDWNAIGGFIATDASRQHIVVAFKGTDSWFDAAMDVSKGMMDSDLCTGCRVHRGFGLAFDKVRAEVERVVLEQRRQPGQETFGVVVTGHSLGGGVATLAAAALRALALPCDLYTYGSPRVGNAAFAAHVSAQPGLTARVTNRRDVVPAVPVYDWRLEPYVHVAPEYWYRDGLDGSDAQYAAPHLVCSSEAQCGSLSCAAWTSVLALQLCSVSDHSQYGGSFQACSETKSLLAGPPRGPPRPEDVSALVAKLAPEAKGLP